MAYYITGISKDSSQKITGYELSNGEVVPKAQAVAMARQGLIEYVNVSVSKTGEEYLRSLPDEYSNNNLDNLPVINLDNKISALPVVDPTNNLSGPIQ